MMIIKKYGDLFNTKFNCLVNTVNCVGVMGAGIAKQFKEKYPEYFLDYREKCLKKEIKIGKVDVYNCSELIYIDKPIIISFPTKNHWRYPSIYRWIELGLEDFIKKINILSGQIDGVAMPYLGCNNGGLEKHIVEKYIYRVENQINIDIELWSLK